VTERIGMGLAAAVAALVIPHAAEAYIGPGAGLSVGGAIIGVLAALVMAAAVVLTWPIRLAIRKIRRNRRPAGPARPDQPGNLRGASSS
jgi:hypothetical protein